MSKLKPRAIHVVNFDNADSFSADFASEPVVPCGVEPSWVRGVGVHGKKDRAAIVLRGQNFRPSGRYRSCLAVHCSPEPQLNMLRDVLRQYVTPLESYGFETDIVAMAYPSPFNSLMKEALGAHLKVFEVMNYTRSSQGVNAYNALVALMRHARKERIWYNYVMLCRMDLNTSPDLVMHMLTPPRREHVVFLDGNRFSPQWCEKMVRLRHGMAQYNGQDFFQAMSGTTVGCVADMLSNQAQLKIPDEMFRQAGMKPSGAPELVWPVECLPTALPWLKRVNASFQHLGKHVSGFRDPKTARSSCPRATLQQVLGLV